MRRVRMAIATFFPKTSCTSRPPLDGRIGQDVIQLARNAVGLALATEKFGGKFFGNGARPMANLSSSRALCPPKMLTFEARSAGSMGRRKRKPAHGSRSGEEYEQTSRSLTKPRPLESRAPSNRNLPRPDDSAAHGRSHGKNSRASTEQIGQEFVTFSLGNGSAGLGTGNQTQDVAAAGPRPQCCQEVWGVLRHRPLVMPSANDLRAFIQAMVQWGVWEPNDACERCT